MQLNRVSCSRGLYFWSLMLCSSHLEILNFIFEFLSDAFLKWSFMRKWIMHQGPSTFVPITYHILPTVHFPAICSLPPAPYLTIPSPHLTSLMQSLTHNSCCPVLSVVIGSHHLEMENLHFAIALHSWWGLGLSIRENQDFPHRMVSAIGQGYSYILSGL